MVKKYSAYSLDPYSKGVIESTSKETYYLAYSSKFIEISIYIYLSQKIFHFSFFK